MIPASHFFDTNTARSKIAASVVLTAGVLLLIPFQVGVTEQKKGAPPAPASSEIVIDAVIASVDEKPITLSELGNRISPPKRLSLQDVRGNEEAQRTLDTIILERVLEAEASLKRVSVVESEIEDYINEVAARNSLPRTEFEAILTKEGKSIEWYRRQVRTDILRTKLASQITRGGISITDSEIDEYLKNSPSFKAEGTSLKLRVITIPRDGASEEDFNARVKKVEDALGAGDEFGDVAKRFSSGPNTEEGGLLGVVAEKDLSSEVFDAVLSIEPGSRSKPVVSDAGAQIFLVEQRFSASDLDEDEDDENVKARREEARRALQKQKTEEKLAAYFTTELYKNHTVDKKF